MKSDKITIVTAFIDINRKNLKGFERSNAKYIGYFEKWARMKNEIVVFSDKQTIQEVIKIRKKYNLLDKTKTYVIDDYHEIDRELHNSIDQAMKSKDLLDFHLQKNIPEALSSNYNYIMALKPWFIKKAIEEKLAAGTIAWLDFGFNYGGKFYNKPEELNFEWEYKFEKKIHLMQVNDFDDLPPYEIIKRNHSYIQGLCIVAPDFLWDTLWELTRSSMIHLNKSGLADDDQLLYLMAYKEQPEIFKLHKMGWCEFLLHFSDKKLSFAKPKKKNIYDFLYKCKHPSEFFIIRHLIYSYTTFKNLRKWKFRG